MKPRVSRGKPRLHRPAFAQRIRGVELRLGNALGLGSDGMPPTSWSSLPTGTILSLHLSAPLTEFDELGRVIRRYQREVVGSRKSHAKVLDFGLAKQSRPTDSQALTEEMLTEPGLVICTIAYMSPETGAPSRKAS